MGLSRGERASAGVSDLAQMDLRIMELSANDADKGAGRLSGERVVWENELLNAVVGGRSGDLRESVAGAGTDPRVPLNEEDRGDGLDGDEANPWGAPEGDGLPNPGDPPEWDGGPKGSRSGEDGIRCAGGDWIEEDNAERMGTGVAIGSCC